MVLAKFKYALMVSCDVDRFFSMYANVLTTVHEIKAYKTSMKEYNIKMSLIVMWNTVVTNSDFKMSKMT